MIVRFCLLHPNTLFHPHNVKKKKTYQICRRIIHQKRKSRNRSSRLRFSRNSLTLPSTLQIASKTHIPLPRLHRRPARPHPLQPEFPLKSPELPFLPALQKDFNFPLPNRPVRKLRKRVRQEPNKAKTFFLPRRAEEKSKVQQRQKQRRHFSSLRKRGQ